MNAMNGTYRRNVLSTYDGPHRRSHGYSLLSSLELTDATGLCENQGGVFFRPLVSFPLRDLLYHSLFYRTTFSHFVSYP